MKSISASIVVLAGAILFAAGALSPGGDSRDMAIAAGGLVGLVGLIGWVATLFRRD